MIDFKTLHPATALWWAQRGQCQRCVHQRAAGMLVRCMVTPIADASRAGTLAYCIDARLESNPCGPAARLFEPKD